MRRGYVIAAEGVHVGLTAEDTGGGFSFVKLMPDPRWPDWQAAPACITVGEPAGAGCGDAVRHRRPPDVRQYGLPPA
jgi:hypothetical protein